MRKKSPMMIRGVIVTLTLGASLLLGETQAIQVPENTNTNTSIESEVSSEIMDMTNQPMDKIDISKLSTGPSTDLIIMTSECNSAPSIETMKTDIIKSSLDDQSVSDDNLNNETVEDVKDKETSTKKEKTKKPKINKKITFHPNNVTHITGVSAETLDYILKDTWLEGYGETFYNLENEYGINAMFSIGNAIMETGWDGNNWLSRNKNNIYGLNMSKKFKSKEACIEYWFDLMDRAYVGEGRTSIASISTKYCPPESSKWQSSIPKIAKKLISKADITLE